MILRGGILVHPKAGYEFYCTRCDVVAKPYLVRERVVCSWTGDQVLERTLFHSRTMRDWSECGGLVVEQLRHGAGADVEVTA